MSSRIVKKQKDDSWREQEQVIMRAPLLKLHTRRSDGEQMQQSNLALSVDERSKLKQNNNSCAQSKADDAEAQVTFTLDDLFSIGHDEMEHNVYQVI